MAGKQKRPTPKVARRIKETENYSKQWHIHQYIGQFARELDRLPDAAQLRKDRQKSAPLNMVDMVF